MKNTEWNINIGLIDFKGPHVMSSTSKNIVIVLYCYMNSKPQLEFKLIGLKFCSPKLYDSFALRGGLGVKLSYR